MLEEEPGQERHTERLDQPVHHQCDQEPLGSSGNPTDGREVHLQHHGIDHQPEENADGDIDLGTFTEFELAQQRGEAGGQFAQGDSHDHAKADPDREVAFKKGEPFGWRRAVGRFRGHQAPLFAAAGLAAVISRLVIKSPALVPLGNCSRIFW